MGLRRLEPLLSSVVKTTLFSPGGQGSSGGSGGTTTPANAYVAEDGTTFYVAEDGATIYVQES